MRKNLSYFALQNGATTPDRLLSSYRHTTPARQHSTTKDHSHIPGLSKTTTDINLQDKWCLTQCIWRKTQKCGLRAYYKENNDITRFVRRTAVLPLVPHHLVENIWLNVLDDIGEGDNVPDTTLFSDYVTAFWVEGHRYLWNHYQTEGHAPHSTWKSGPTRSRNKFTMPTQTSTRS